MWQLAIRVRRPPPLVATHVTRRRRSRRCRLSGASTAIPLDLWGQRRLAFSAAGAGLPAGAGGEQVAVC